MQSPSEDGVPGSRCFVVCGKAISAEDLQASFEPFGDVTGVKVVREKGVAYVKFDRASSAALAIENLNGAVLNNGRGPKLKVLLADAPSSRSYGHAKHSMPEPELSSDPDNVPPRSRLFIVVPKQADSQAIKDEFSRFADLEYCKTDLIASKGVVFCKFSKSSAALRALEDISDSSMLSGYKVKVMLAEPKTKRLARMDGVQDIMYNMPQVSRIDPYGYAGSMDALKLNQVPQSIGNNHMSGGMGLEHFNISGLNPLGSSLSNFTSLANNMNNNAMGPMGNGMGNGMSNGMGLGLGNNIAAGMGGGMGLHADSMHLNGQGSLGLIGSLGGQVHTSVSPVSPNNLPGMQYSKQRLFVVVHKGVSEELLVRLFRRFPGMEYCDLKKDRATGKSKGFCYVNYSTPEAAAEAVAQLNGVEFPPHSGHRIKVMHAEPLGARSNNQPMGSAGSNPNTHPGSSLSSRSPGMMSMPVSSGSVSHTPLSRSTGLGTVSGVGPITPDTMASVSTSMANMSLHLTGGMPGSGGVGDGLVDPATAAHLASPMATVARELIYPS